MVRTRIAPSPTGFDLHVGTVATALINYAWAKKNNGQFIIRIEDTDRERLVKGGEEKMLATLKRIGLTPDESPEVGGEFGPYRQSDRLEIYKKYAKELVKKNKAYYCICTSERLDKMRKEQQANKKIPKYDRQCFDHQEEVIKKIKLGEKHVIRMFIPDKEITFHDIIRGKIVIQGSALDDQVLLKSDGFPTYHLAVVVDDHLMEITHIIRAEEWLPSTPKHIVLYQAFGWRLPEFAHVSLLRNPDRSKLSKRKNPVWVSWYLDQGIFPKAFLNYLALMGWSHPDGKEIFSVEEYIKVFDLKDVKTTAPIFDPVKLEWMNGEYIRNMKQEDLRFKIYEFYNKKYPEKLIEKTIPLVQERMKKLADYLPLCEFFFKAPEKYDLDFSKKKEFLGKVHQSLEKITDWKVTIISEQMQKLAQELKIKNSQFFMDLRIAITGKKISPPLNESMEILGKKECLKRVRKLII